MSQGLKSAAIAFSSFSGAIVSVASSINEVSNSFADVANRMHEMALAKNKEYDRVLYLKEIQKYTGYKITLFADIINLEESRQTKTAS